MKLIFKVTVNDTVREFYDVYQAFYYIEYMRRKTKNNNIKITHEYIDKRFKVMFENNDIIDEYDNIEEARLCRDGYNTIFKSKHIVILDSNINEIIS